jgi:predicted nucleic acid-binding protein
LIFIDSNIPMYLIGTAHPHKTEAQVILERPIARAPLADAEVLQEIEKCEAIGQNLLFLEGRHFVNDV